MNYRHGYHAGNFADVLKHTALCELLRLLTAKDKKLFVLDTHAGTGGYDLAGNRLREGLRQVRASAGGGAVGGVVEVAPWSRIPEARALVVPRDV